MQDAPAPRRRATALRLGALLPLLCLVSLGLPATAQAQDTGDDCSTWGEIVPAERAVAVGEFVTFRVDGAGRCGDVDTCSWWADGSRGDFLQSTGSPVTWRAPTELEDCVTIEFRVWASCTDGGTTGYSDLTLRCSHEQLEEVQASRNAQISGGGCNGPTPAPDDGGDGGTSAGDTGLAGALLLLPLAGLVRRLRRR